METFLVLNGYELRATVEEAERIILDVASGRCTREQLMAWLRTHLASR